MSAKHAILAGLMGLALQGCSGPDEGAGASTADNLTRAQRDSIAASLPIPGARGVGAAMQARDAANARTQAHDSIGS